MLSAHAALQAQRSSDGSLSLAIEVENFGLVPSPATPLTVTFQVKDQAALTLDAKVPALEPYATTRQTVTIPAGRAISGATATVTIRIGDEPAGRALVVPGITVP
jgi:hypothetical protein